MDKIGPIARTVEDCALVFNAIYGPDELDATVYDAPFNYDARGDLKKLRVGCLQKDFDSDFRGIVARCSDAGPLHQPPVGPPPRAGEDLQ